jgi:molybdate/tungstate transport system substrate-binding protein
VLLDCGVYARRCCPSLSVGAGELPWWPTTTGKPYSSESSPANSTPKQCTTQLTQSNGVEQHGAVLERSILVFIALVMAGAASPGCRERNEIIVFHAPSLSRALSEINDEFTRAHPDKRLRVEVSGSQLAARKLIDLKLRADVVALADAEIFERMLIPDHVEWCVLFATNEIVLAHAAHSRYTEEVTTENWPEVLTRRDVRLGMANPETSPLGYRTLMVWQLTELAGRAGLAQTLRDRIVPEHLMADEGELWALLSSRAVDYAFLYRSTAEDHRLKLTALPDAANLGRPELGAQYARAAVPVVLEHGEAPSTLRGAPIWHAISVPRRAPHAEWGTSFAAFLLGDAGRRALERAGLRPIHPARCARWDSLPSELKPLTIRSPQE